MGENIFCGKNTLGRALFFVDTTTFGSEENTRNHFELDTSGFVMLTSNTKRTTLVTTAPKLTQLRRPIYSETEFNEDPIERLGRYIQ